MIEKRPIRPNRVRKVPKQFSWLDHRLVRERHIERLSCQAAALYLFLVAVADGQGLSYYSDSSVMKRLSMDEAAFADARESLIRFELIAFEKPLYQVLSLDPEPRPAIANNTRPSMDQPVSLAQIFKTINGGAS